MSGRRYAFDLDGTLCHTIGGDYENAEPWQERLEYVRALHAAGSYIIIFTARGDLEPPRKRRRILSLTREQLRDWGVPFHELRAKPFAHLYVDDRGMSADEFFNQQG